MIKHQSIDTSFTATQKWQRWLPDATVADVYGWVSDYCRQQSNYEYTGIGLAEYLHDRHHTWANARTNPHVETPNEPVDVSIVVPDGNAPSIVVVNDLNPGWWATDYQEVVRDAGGKPLMANGMPVTVRCEGWQGWFLSNTVARFSVARERLAGVGAFVRRVGGWFHAAQIAYETERALSREGADPAAAIDQFRRKMAILRNHYPD